MVIATLSKVSYVLECGIVAVIFLGHTLDSFAIINLNFVLLALEYINVIETSMHNLKQTF